MNVLDGGCFVALCDSLVAVDLRLVEDVTCRDLLARSNPEHDAQRLNACVITPTTAGLWYVYALTESSGCDIDETRVAALVCISASVLDPALVSTSYLLELPWKELRGDESQWYSNKLQVECGTVGFLCMESIRRCAKAHGLTAESNEAFCKYIRNWANAMCQATTTSSKICLSNMPNGPIGAVSSVGICDNGTYYCSVLRDDVTGEVSGIKVMFPSAE
ncbi:hypothetical protein, conserved [Babesia ovata]|uniref:Uncharacterized protein n=1 Tax=Babesia ovata TaxID=189622 RepID=A0A2H6KEN8_9APIC|nr:uncharacterized protein BOVATA_029490 [Babesia ovata]GBE61456.1 hypothetical protein, conserved [Babesia ovata]